MILSIIPLYPYCLLTIITLFFLEGWLYYLGVWIIIILSFLILFLLKKEKVIVHRLTTDFVELKIPMIKGSVISQKRRNITDDSITLSGRLCKPILKELKNEKKSLPKSLKSDWTYLAITHKTIIDHLNISKVMDERRFRIKYSCFKESLNFTQKNF